MSWNGKEIAAALLGNGSDGDVTISGTTTLTRDMYYNSLTVSGSGVLVTAHYRVFSRTFIENNGVIHADGVNATTTTGATVTQGTLLGGRSGGNGGTTTGTGGTSSTISPDKCANGGAGGTGSGGAGGVLGTRFATSPALGGPNPFLISATAVMGNYPYSPTQRIAGGAGGGGGGGNGAAAGGGGGSGGGVIFLFAQKIFGTGTIRANGGNGAAASNANTGGGGGGGGGCAVLVCANAISQTSLVFTFNGGTGGAGNGTGTAGANGSNGTGYFNIRTVL